jgi:hypothetical protein
MQSRVCVYSGHSVRQATAAPPLLLAPTRARERNTTRLLLRMSSTVESSARSRCTQPRIVVGLLLLLCVVIPVVFILAGVDTPASQLLYRAESQVLVFHDGYPGLQQQAPGPRLSQTRVEAAESRAEGKLVTNAPLQKKETLKPILRSVVMPSDSDESEGIADDVDVVVPACERDSCQARALLAALQKYGSGIGRILVLWDACDGAAGTSLPSLLPPNAQRRFPVIVRALRGLCVYSGWYRQQAAKLLAADTLVTTAYYLILDAKNIPIRPFNIRSMFDVDGRAYRIWHDKADGIHETWFNSTCQLYGLDDNRCQEMAMQVGASITPRLFHTATVRALITDLTSKAGRSSNDSTMQDVRSAEVVGAIIKSEATEFYMYEVFARRDPAHYDQVHSSVHQQSKLKSHTIWKGSCNDWMPGAFDPKTLSSVAFFGFQHGAAKDCLPSQLQVARSWYDTAGISAMVHEDPLCSSWAIV